LKAHDAAEASKGDQDTEPFTTVSKKKKNKTRKAPVPPTAAKRTFKAPERYVRSTTHRHWRKKSSKSRRRPTPLRRQSSWISAASGKRYLQLISLKKK
jgi:hypothetical protein